MAESFINAVVWLFLVFVVEVTCGTDEVVRNRRIYVELTDYGGLKGAALVWE